MGVSLGVTASFLQWVMLLCVQPEPQSAAVCAGVRETGAEITNSRHYSGSWHLLAGTSCQDRWSAVQQAH